jgi:hypothetical protein
MGVAHIMARLLRDNDAVRYPRVYGKRDYDGGVVVTFTFTQSVEFDGAELVGLSDREIIERARVMAAAAYDFNANGGAYLLLGDADADLENMGAE